MSVELRLQKFIDAMQITSDIDNLDNDAPQVMRRTSSAIQKTSTFVVSKAEPHDMILPLNVIWLCFDPSSSYYKNALRRVSKDADSNGSFEHTWEVMYFYDDIWGDQYYDGEDMNNMTGNTPGAATTTSLGLVTLVGTPDDPQNPAVILEGDTRLSDPRVPLPHSHPEKPATMVQHDDGILTIANGTPAPGSMLISTSTTEAAWRIPTEDDLANGA
jgi:hypothetical protein